MSRCVTISNTFLTNFNNKIGVIYRITMNYDILSLDEKSLSILNLLGENRIWVTCSYISQKLGINPRSVRYIISKINKQNHIIISSNKGYLLNEDVKADSFPTRTNIPSNSEERKKYIFEQLIILNKMLNIDDLSEYFHISPVTLKNSLPVLKKELADYSLYLKTKKNNLYVIGKEKDKRKFAVKLIRDEVEHSSFSLGNIQQFFQVVNLEDIKDLVIGVFSKHQYFLDDFSLLNYILHLAVCVELSKNNNQIQTKSHHSTISMDNLNSIASDEVIMIVKEIAEHMNLMYGADFSFEGIVEASILVTTRIIPRQSNTFDFDNIGQVVGDDIKDLITNITSSVYERYSIDLSNKQMMVRFALHLKNLLVRVENNMAIQNGQFVNIKNDYPFLYDISVFVSYIIANKMHCVLPEDEIAYIALHIGVMIEQETAHQEKLSCVIIATDYYAIGKTLLKKISRTFSQSLFIQNLLTDLEKIDSKASEIDLIISTYPIRDSKIPCIVVGPFLSESDIAEIYSRIEAVKQIKKKNYVQTKIEMFLKKDLCFFGRDFKTAEDAIEVMCNYMTEMHYVQDSFKQEIYEHENIAPSSYGNIAIAHTFSNSELPSMIAMSINPTPIIWGNNNVNIVFIITLNQKDNRLFKDIFKFMTDIVSNEQALSRILKATNYEELMEIFKLYI